MHNFTHLVSYVPSLWEPVSTAATNVWNVVVSVATVAVQNFANHCTDSWSC